MKLRYLILVVLILNFCVSALAETTYEIHDYTIADGLPSNLISCAEQDSRGLLWLGTWRGLCCFDGYEFISFNDVGDETERPLCSRLHSITPDSNNNIWCVTYDRRLYLFDTSSCRYTDVSQLWEKRLGRPFRVRNVYALDNGVVWVTCYEEDNLTFRITDIDSLADAPEETANVKAGKWDAEKEHWHHHRRTTDVSHIPGMKPIAKYCLDSQDNIWRLGHKLTRITPKKQMFEIEEGDTDVATRTIGGVAEIDGCPVYSAFTDSRGRRWIGTKGGGLYLSTSAGMQHFADNPADKYSLLGNDVYDIFEDSRGRIWVACYDKGINLVDDSSGSIRFINSANRLPYPKNDKFAKVRHVMETREGEIVLSTADGLVAFDVNAQRPEDIVFHTYTQSRREGSLPGGNVMQTLQGCDGRIYISTMTGGLITLTGGHLLADDAEFAPVDGTQNNSGIVIAFIEDADGNLWLAREDYIEKYDPAKGGSQVFGKKEFGRQVYFSEAMPKYDAERGKITFGTYGGTLSFEPKGLAKSAHEPNILFSSVQYQGEQERVPIIYKGELDVPANRRNLNIFFSALDYQDNDAVQYAFKLVDADYRIDADNGEGWNYVGKAHCASFNHLPPGRLKLLVKSTNADGVWSNEVAELKIHSRPTFWETPWAWLLYIIIIMAIVGVAVYIVQLRARHRRERQELEFRLDALLRGIENPAPPTSAHGAVGESKPVTFTLPEVKIETEEKIFMEKLMAYLDANISNSGLKIGELAEHLGMSRTVFYEQVKAITDMSPVDFVRYLRIQRAKQMLVGTDLPVSQIAYEIGFSEPNYFGKVFKQSTGQSPLNFRKAMKVGNGEQ